MQAGTIRKQTPLMLLIAHDFCPIQKGVDWDDHEKSWRWEQNAHQNDSLILSWDGKTRLSAWARQSTQLRNKALFTAVWCKGDKFMLVYALWFLVDLDIWCLSCSCVDCQLRRHRMSKLGYKYWGGACCGPPPPTWRRGQNWASNPPEAA